MSRLEIKLGNFENALNRLKEAVEELKKDTAGDIVRDGVIQRFEFTYELAWKATKEYLEDVGIADKNSPKAVIKEAYAQRLITEEKNWLLMLNDRNMASHVYEEKMAQEISDRIISSYVGEFDKLLVSLKSNLTP